MVRSLDGLFADEVGVRNLETSKETNPPNLVTWMHEVFPHYRGQVMSHDENGGNLGVSPLGKEDFPFTDQGSLLVKAFFLQEIRLSIESF